MQPQLLRGISAISASSTAEEAIILIASIVASINRVSKIRGALVNCIKSEKERDRRRVRKTSLQIVNGRDLYLHRSIERM